MESVLKIGITIVLPLVFGLTGEYIAHRIAEFRRRRKGLEEVK